MTQAPDGTFRLVVTDALPEGPAEVRILVEDTAGRILDERLGVVTLDETLPTLVSTSVNIGAATVGDVVFYSVVASEPLAEPPEVNTGDLTLTYVEGTAYIFSHEVGSEGERSVNLTLTDRAGNRAAGISGTSIVIDVDPPVLENVRASAPASPTPGSGTAPRGAWPAARRARRRARRASMRLRR